MTYTVTDDEKIALRDAVRVLIEAPDAIALYDALSATVPVAGRAPVKLTGDAATLNPLLRLALQNPAGYRGVLDLAEERRALRGLPPLEKPKPSGYNKVEYMRQFMDQKRERQKLAAKIENMLRPEKDRLVGNARLEFMNLQSARWKVMRDRALDRAKAAHGGKLTAETRRQVLESFWAAVDANLEDRLHQAQQAQLNPNRRRDALADTDLSELMQALNAPPR